VPDLTLRGLLGEVGLAPGQRPSRPSSPRRRLEWKRLPDVEERPDLDAEVRLPSDYQQPTPLRLRLLFQPEQPGVYDLEWLAPAGSRLRPGDPVVRAYRASDGLAFEQRAGFPLTVVEPLLPRNARAVAGDPVATVESPSLALDEEPIRAIVAEMRMELAQAVNAVVKGYMGSLGEGGQVTERLVPVSTRLHPERGCEALMAEIVEALSGAGLEEGDIVVAGEKLFAIAQRRLFPLRILYEHDPKTLDAAGRRDLLEKVREYVEPVDEVDLICADSLRDWPEEPMATLGVHDPNRVARELASRIEGSLGVRCDVVISDTDTGLDVRETMIGCVTIGATPLGATAGLVIYECMRVANAAEFCRGSSRGIPLVVCKPHPRRRRREGMGEFRGYGGRLDAARERLLGFA
jgi:hypothetical protein